MKFWAKVNRGLIVIVAVAAAVAVYLVGLYFSQSSARPRIETICRNYIKTAVGYSMLPEKYRDGSVKITSSGLSGYEADMEKDIGAFYPAGGSTSKYVLSQYKASLENQAKGKNLVYSYTKKIDSFSSFSFSGSTVTVSILVNTSYNGPSSAANIDTGVTATVGSGYSTPVSGQTTDTVTLQKTGGKWYVVYADLQQPVSGAAYSK